MFNPFAAQRWRSSRSGDDPHKADPGNLGSENFRPCPGATPLNPQAWKTLIGLWPTLGAQL